jgi:CheY-like chemotaxis protein
MLIESKPEDVLFLRDVLVEIGEGRYWNNWVNLEILHARSWSEASAILSSEAVDIVLLDLDVLDSQGIETFRRAQRGAQNIPMVLLLGASEESVGVRMVRDGAQDFSGEEAGRLRAARARDAQCD